MLVLSRKKNESIVIDGDISIIIVEIRGDKVRLGIEAPKNVTVHRKEVFEAIQSKERAEVAAGQTEGQETVATVAKSEQEESMGKERPPLPEN